MSFIRVLSKQYQVEQGRIIQAHTRDYYGSNRIEERDNALLDLTEQYIVRTVEEVYGGKFNATPTDIKSADEFIGTLISNGAPAELIVCGESAKAFRAEKELKTETTATIQASLQKKITDLCNENLANINVVFAYACRMLDKAKDENKEFWRQSLQALMHCDIDPTVKISKNKTKLLKDEELNAFEFLDKYQQKEDEILYQIYLLIKKKSQIHLESKSVQMDKHSKHDDSDVSDNESESADINKPIDINKIIGQSKKVLDKVTDIIVSSKDNPEKLEEYKLEITILLDKILNQLVTEKYFPGCFASKAFQWLEALDSDNVSIFLTRDPRAIADRLVLNNDIASINSLKKLYKNEEIIRASFYVLTRNGYTKPLVANPLFVSLRSEHEQCFKDFISDNYRELFRKLLVNDDFDTLQYFYANEIMVDQLIEISLSSISLEDAKSITENKYYKLFITTKPEKVHAYLEKSGQNIFQQLAKNNDFGTLEYYLKNKVGVDALVLGCLNLLFDPSTPSEPSAMKDPLFEFLNKNVSLVEYIKKHSELVCRCIVNKDDKDMIEYVLKNNIDPSYLVKECIENITSFYRYSKPLINNPQFQFLQKHCAKELNIALAAGDIVSLIIDKNDIESLEFIAKNNLVVDAELLVKQIMETRKIAKFNAEDPLFKHLLQFYSEALKKYCSNHTDEIVNPLLKNGDSASLNCFLENRLVNLFHIMRNKEFSIYDPTQLSEKGDDYDRRGWYSKIMMDTLFKIDIKHIVLQMQLVLEFILQQKFTEEDLITYKREFTFKYNGFVCKLPMGIEDMSNMILDAIKMNTQINSGEKPKETSKVVTALFLKLINEARNKTPKETDANYLTNMSKILQGIGGNGGNSEKTALIQYLNSMLLLDEAKIRNTIEARFKKGSEEKSEAVNIGFFSGDSTSDLLAKIAKAEAALLNAKANVREFKGM